MRWPNRTPHTLTQGMRTAQSGLVRFLPLINWQRFRRRNLNEEIGGTHCHLALFGSGNDEQAIAWLLRTDSLGPDGRVRQDVEPVLTSVTIPGLRPGTYRITAWDTRQGLATNVTLLQHTGDDTFCTPLPPILTDMAVAVQRCAV